MRRSLALLCVVACLAVLALMLTAGLASAHAPKPPAPPTVDWTQLLTYDQQAQLLQDLHAAYPKTTKLFSIGHSWLERQLWCLELSAPIAAAKHKTGVALFGNIHGGEQQGGMGAAYTAWWLATQYGKDATASKILGKYNVYIVPLINPDGYQQSFIVSTRQNMRPTDHNGIAGPFSDPYFDTNGDGVIAQIYTGPAGPPQTGGRTRGRDAAPLGRDGYESPDFDRKRLLRRRPDGQPRRHEPQLRLPVELPRRDRRLRPLGQNAWTTAGPDAASEPEVQAVQNFLITHPVAA